MTCRFPVIILQDCDGMFTAHVPTLPGCHTQAKTLPALYRRMREVIALCTEVQEERASITTPETFVGLQHIEVEL